MIRTITTQDKIKILKREIAMRKKVYFGEMSQEEADYEIRGMTEILEDYQGRQVKLFGEE